VDWVCFDPDARSGLTLRSSIWVPLAPPSAERRRSVEQVISRVIWLRLDNEAGDRRREGEDRIRETADRREEGHVTPGPTRWVRFVIRCNRRFRLIYAEKNLSPITQWLRLGN
jgi:hypothetical protein